MAVVSPVWQCLGVTHTIYKYIYTPPNSQTPRVASVRLLIPIYIQVYIHSTATLLTVGSKIGVLFWNYSQCKSPDRQAVCNPLKDCPPGSLPPVSPGEVNTGPARPGRTVLLGGSCLWPMPRSGGAQYQPTRGFTIWTRGAAAGFLVPAVHPLCASPCTKIQLKLHGT